MRKEDTYEMLAAHVELFNFLRGMVPELERLTTQVAAVTPPSKYSNGRSQSDPEVTGGLADLRRALDHATEIGSGVRNG